MHETGARAAPAPAPPAPVPPPEPPQTPADRVEPPPATASPEPTGRRPTARRGEAEGRAAIKVFLDQDQVRELLRRQAAGVINRQPITVSAIVREAVRRYLEAEP